MNQQYPGLSLTWGAAGVVALAVLSAVMRSPMITSFQLVLALAIICAGVVPVLWYGRTAAPSHFPLFPLAGLFYVICFAAPFLVLDVIWPDGFPEYDYDQVTSFPIRGVIAAPEALMLVLGGVAAFVGAFLFVRKPLEARMGHFGLSAEPSAGPLRVLSYALLAGFLAHEFLPAIQGIASISQLLGRVGFVAFAVLFVAWQERLIGRAEALAVFGVILPAVILHKVFTSLYTPVLMFGLLFFILIWPVYKKQATAVVLVSAVFIGLFYLPAQEYRTQTNLPQYTATKANASLGAKAKFFMRVSVAVWSGEKTVRFGEQDYTLNGTSFLMGVGRRIFLMPLFYHVYVESPERVAYWRGESYKNIATSFIPRALWKNKP